MCVYKQSVVHISSVIDLYITDDVTSVHHFRLFQGLFQIACSFDRFSLWCKNFLSNVGVYRCICIFIYVCICIYVYYIIYIYINVHNDLYTCIYVPMYISIYTHLHRYTLMSIIYIHTFKH